MERYYAVSWVCEQNYDQVSIDCCFEAPNDGNDPSLVWAVFVVVIACKDFGSDFCRSLSTNRSKAANFLKICFIPTWGPSRHLGLTAGQGCICYQFQIHFCDPPHLRSEPGIFQEHFLSPHGAQFWLGPCSRGGAGLLSFLNTFL